MQQQQELAQDEVLDGQAVAEQGGVLEAGLGGFDVPVAEVAPEEGVKTLGVGGELVLLQVLGRAVGQFGEALQDREVVVVELRGVAALQQLREPHDRTQRRLQIVRGDVGEAFQLFVERHQLALALATGIEQREGAQGSGHTHIEPLAGHLGLGAVVVDLVVLDHGGEVVLDVALAELVRARGQVQRAIEGRGLEQLHGVLVRDHPRRLRRGGRCRHLRHYRLCQPPGGFHSWIHHGGGRVRRTHDLHEQGGTARLLRGGHDLRRRHESLAARAGLRQGRRHLHHPRQGPARGNPRRPGSGRART